MSAAPVAERAHRRAARALRRRAENGEYEGPAGREEILKWARENDAYAKALKESG